MSSAYALVSLVAALVFLLTPLALLFGVEPWRVGTVALFELLITFWTARWARQR